MVVGSPPCNGCVKCCQRDCIRILPGDEPGKYKTVPHKYFPGELMLEHKANGECIYLGTVDGVKGCTIHADKPQMCKEFDCRVIAMMYSFEQARKLDKFGRLRLAVWRQGKNLLKEIRRGK